MIGDSFLTGARRERELAELADRRVDVLVVGGGITGVGVALDAASRGLSVALVEAHDLAFGTSRWSSKLVHGGLRYLAHGEVGIAYESARERAVLMQTVAPHLVRPLPMLVPYFAATGRLARAIVAAGTRAGEAVALAARMATPAARTSPPTLPHARRISAEEAAAWVPSLRRGDLAGGMLGWEGQLEDDARLVVAVARTAAAYGAAILPGVRALALSGEGARLRDEHTGAELTVEARSVVNAAGVWADHLAADPAIRLRPSKGTHVVLRGTSLGDPGAALMSPVPGDSRRYVFALPHADGHLICGLTDDPVDDLPDVPTTTDDEIAFILDTLSRTLARPLSTGAVIGSYAGLRPLVASHDPTSRTGDLSRRHLVHRGNDGVVSVVGGKLTTYRQMAEDTVDALGLTDLPARTARLPLVGAATPQALGRLGAPPRLVRRYGAEAPQVAALVEEDRTLRQPVAPGLPVLGVELAWGVLAEGASSVEDLLERRTRLSLVNGADAAVRETAADILDRCRSRLARGAASR